MIFVIIPVYFFPLKLEYSFLKKGKKIKQFKVHTISNRDIVLSQS